MISGYVTLLDPGALGLERHRLRPRPLDQQVDRHLVAFEAAVTTLPEAIECYLMTGESDYQLRLEKACLPNGE